MRKLCIFLLALFPILSIAKNAQDVKTELLTLYPKANITSVKETPIQGLFEIGLGDRIAYVSDSQNTSEDAFRYWIFGGSLFDVGPRPVLLGGGRGIPVFFPVFCFFLER